MEAKRAEISARILRGMKLSTLDYSFPTALSDVEAYYRAGTFTGGLLSTSEIVAADAREAAAEKADALIIRNPEAPLPPPPTNRPPADQAPRADVIRLYQTALCLTVDGKVGPDFFKGAEDFIRGHRGSSTQVTKLSKGVEEELEEARDGVADCKAGKFKNSFEVGAYGVGNEAATASSRMKGLQARLGVDQTGSFNDATRNAIKKFREDNKTIENAVPARPELADQMDAKLKRLLFP